MKSEESEKRAVHYIQSGKMSIVVENQNSVEPLCSKRDKHCEIDCLLSICT